MSKDRIQIDGVWYVKESSVEKTFEYDLIHSRSITIENDVICYEFSVLEDEGDDGEPVYSMPSCEVKFKSGIKEEFWDNGDWMIRFYKGGDKDADNEIAHIDQESREMFRQVLESAIEKGYLKL